ncbi:hypothetical protein BY458DRAFT_584947 [Sporodiniella umbellata]|nr:hypothetical protein BY458DRAFT_584947 [Sporodiniella umbellata]
MTETKPVIAHHPYEAQREDEISFEKNELIQVVDDSDPDWWVGRKKDGVSGYFPSNFVDIAKDREEKADAKEPIEKEPTEETVENETEEKEQEKEETEKENVDHIIGMARVMEDYAMQETGELSLHRGGIVNIYEIVDDRWARGELNGKVGKYPTEFVEEIDMPDIGRQAVPQKSEEEQTTGPKGGFKLAAFGVKQGGIGSLFSGGLPGLKKTTVKTEESKPSPKAEQTEEKESSPKAEEPRLAKPPVFPTSEEKPKDETKKTASKAIVLHPYDADGEDELNLLRGEYVEILDRHADEGWWKGKNERGDVGVFPSNFVKEMDQTTAPPPVRSRSIASSARPVSVGSSATARPISVQNAAPRPSTVQVLSTADQQPALSAETSETIPEQSMPITSDTLESPVKEEAQSEPKVENEKQAFEKEQDHKETVPEKEAEEKKEDEAVLEIQKEVEEEAVPEVRKEEAAPEVRKEEAVPEVRKEVVPEVRKEVVPEIKKEEVVVPETKTEEVVPELKEEVMPEIKKEAEKEETVKEEEKASRDIKVEAETNGEEKKDTQVAAEGHTEEEEEELPTGPRLATPARPRIGGARRPRQMKSDEPSQTEMLQKEIAEAPEEEKKAAPAKPVKPIFAKFPTPFAMGAEDLSKRALKPTTRKPWEEEKSGEVEESEAPRPVGVKNIASRFNVPSSGNEVLETKLKNHTKNEVEKIRKEMMQLLQQEQEKNSQLENLVQELLERVKALEQHQ